LGRRPLCTESVAAESGTRWEDAWGWDVEEEEDAVDTVGLRDRKVGSVIGFKLKVGEGGCARLEAHFWVSKGALVRGDGKEVRGRLATD
jgi:hypothetical protein